MSSSIPFISSRMISPDVTVMYGMDPRGYSPIVEQTVITMAGERWDPAKCAQYVWIYDSYGRPTEQVLSEEVKIVHIHPSFTDSVDLALDAGKRGDARQISELIARVETCKSKCLWHLDNHPCSYNVKFKPSRIPDAKMLSSFHIPVEERLAYVKTPDELRSKVVNIRGILQHHAEEDGSLLNYLRSRYLEIPRLETASAQ